MIAMPPHRPPFRRRRPARRARRGTAPAPLRLALPAPSAFRVGDALLTLSLLALPGFAAWWAVQRPRPAPPQEEILEMAEVPPPPVEAKEPPKPPPPPPAPPPPSPKAAPARPVFGMRAEETTETGGLEVAAGNTLAAKPDSVVQAPPPPLYAEPVELDRAPGFLRQAMADYPAWAQDQGVEAVVLVWVTIDAEGRVTDASLKRGAGKDFDAAALRAARASLFQPLVREGRRLPSRFTVTYDFKLEG